MTFHCPIGDLFPSLSKCVFSSLKVCLFFLYWASCPLPWKSQRPVSAAWQSRLRVAGDWQACAVGAAGHQRRPPGWPPSPLKAQDTALWKSHRACLGNPRSYHSSGMLMFQEDSSRPRCYTFHSQKQQKAQSPQYPSVLSPHPESLLFQLPSSILPSLAFIPCSREKHSWPFCNERPTKMHPVTSEHPLQPLPTHTRMSVSHHPALSIQWASDF